MMRAGRDWQEGLGRKVRRCDSGFTLAEVLVAMAASTVIIGGLLISSLSLQRTLRGSEAYAVSYSDQRRLTDFIARDLRRALSIAKTDESGVRQDFVAQSGSVTIANKATLLLTLPAYYRSQNPAEEIYDDALDVVSGADRLDYGTEKGVAQPVEVSFRRIFYGKEGCVCYLRQEFDREFVIVRKAEDLSVQISASPISQSIGVKSWFHSAQRATAPLVCTYDRLLLRNPPLSFRP